MIYPIDLYYEIKYNNDLLYLTYIVSNNVKEIKRDLNNIIVIPNVEDDSLFNKITDCFTDVIDFYRNLELEGEYKNEIIHFKHRFERLSFISAYELFKKLKQGKKEEEQCFNIESSHVGILANDLAICKGFEHAPKTLGDFYKKYEIKVKYKKLSKEAKDASISHSC